MRTPPSKNYNGLTLILDKPSRFDLDNNRLLSAQAGEYIQECIAPLNLVDTDIRDLTEPYNTFLPGTNKIALMGAESRAKYTKDTTPPEGYPLFINRILSIGTFYPQDCCDHRNIEGKNEEDDDTAVSDRETKDLYPTRRMNYRFWTRIHLQKLIQGPKIIEPPPRITCYPIISQLVTILNNTHNEDIFLDIETSRLHRNLSCIGFSTTRHYPEIFVVPIYLYNGARAYSDLHLFWQALSLALTRNTAVIHNAGFDLLILHAWFKFHLPARVYDTMIAQHRIFPEAEKSLSHAISTWTWQGFHKNVSTEVYDKKGQDLMWTYNGRDVYNLKLIKDAQLDYAKNDPGLLASIENGNSEIIPYLDNSITGLRIDLLQQATTEAQLLLAKTQYARLATILTGIPNFNPGSSKQCADFFHKKLNYPVVARGETNAPSVGRKQLYQLQLKHNNPLIPVILKYRTAAKDLSMLSSELFTTPLTD